MRKLYMGLILGLVSSASFAQAVITFDVDFNEILLGSAAQVPTLYATVSDPSNYGSYGAGYTPNAAPNLTGTVTLTAVASSTLLADPTPGISNSITLNGSFTTDWGIVPANNRQKFTYTDARYQLFDPGAKFANDYNAAAPQPIFIGTAVDQILSDQGGPKLGCPFPTALFGAGGNCESANPALFLGHGSLIFDTTANGGVGAAVYPTLADTDLAGPGAAYPIVSGSSTTIAGGGYFQFPGLEHDDGLDGFFFEGGLCTGVDLSPCQGGNVAAGGKVQIWVVSSDASNFYIVEGTTLAAAAVPVPAAVWLFGSALGLLGWMRRRVA